MTRWRLWTYTIVALLAALPQVARFSGHVERGDFTGSAYLPRVEALINASTATLEGGPFATVPAGGRYSVAPDLFNDLGTATIISLWTKATGRQATRETLGNLNLAYLASACVLLVLAFPPRLRLGLVPVFLLVDLVSPRYSNVDTVAIHGSLAALAVAIPLIAILGPRAWMAFLCGALLFVVHKTRSVYGVYAVLALLSLLLFVWPRFRDRKPLYRAAALILGFALCEAPWRLAVQQRLADSRLVEKDALPEHATYAALISGIGWTTNPWGIKPWDPWVSQFLADSVNGPVVRISTHESERRARLVFFRLASQRPLALASLYIGRIPKALGDYSVFGEKGALAWVLAALVAVGLALRRGDAEGLAVVLAPVGVALCLLLQIILVDVNYIYAHPLELVSALILVTAVPVALRNARPAGPAKD